MTNFNLSNPFHAEILISTIATLVSAAMYISFIKSKRRKEDQDAFHQAEATFGARIDKLNENKFILSPPENLSFWTSLFNPGRSRRAQEQARLYEMVLLEMKFIRKEIQEFQDAHRGKIDEKLEDAIQHLYQATAVQPLNIDAIVSSLEGVRIVAERLGLDQDSMHLVHSVILQLRKSIR